MVFLLNLGLSVLSCEPIHMFVTLHFLFCIYQLSDHNKRADKMLHNADKINCRKFVRPKVKYRVIIHVLLKTLKNVLLEKCPRYCNVYVFPINDPVSPYTVGRCAQ